jgi:hypothetical protein
MLAFVPPFSGEFIVQSTWYPKVPRAVGQGFAVVLRPAGGLKVSSFHKIMPKTRSSNRMTFTNFRQYVEGMRNYNKTILGYPR